MITFHVLGALDLRGPDRQHVGSPLSGSKRLALLAYLALGVRRGLHRRDTLAGLFWPDSDPRQARNALSNMLHQVRRSLRPDVLVVQGHEELGLDDDLFWCDAVAFRDALDEGRLADALQLYRGDLLEGLVVADASPEFHHWLDAKRAALRDRALEAARALTEKAAESSDISDAIRWARRTLEIDPYDERAARRLITLLDEAGDRAGAVRTYDDLVYRLAREFDVEPSADTQKLMRGIRVRHEHVDGPGATAGVTRQIDSATTGTYPAHVVAVLPFENMSGTSDAEPFAAGLHDDLLTELSRISALKVIARTSVMRYRGAMVPLREVARELGVGTVVEGGLRIAGDRLRVNVQVIDVESGAHRWAERYDRELNPQSIFDLQAELCGEIAQALRTELTDDERDGHLGIKRTEDLDAYRLCVQGRTLIDQRTPHAMRRAVEYFQRAIDRDPNYALAWSGLADCLSLLEFYGLAAPPSAPGPVAAAQRALELGPGLGQAHASLGIIRAIRQQSASALSELERAIALAPSHAEAHAWLGWLHLVRGFPEEALSAERRAVELDPLAPAFRAYLAEIYLANGQPDDALREAERARELQPEYGLAHFMEGLVLYHVGRFSEALSAVETSLAVVPPWGSPRHAEVHAMLAVIQVAIGDREAARVHLEQIDAAVDPFVHGFVLAALGDEDEAFLAFGRVSDWRSFATDFFRYFFADILGPLRSDRRWGRVERTVDDSWRKEP